MIRRLRAVTLAACKFAAITLVAAAAGFMVVASLIDLIAKVRK